MQQGSRPQLVARGGNGLRLIVAQPQPFGCAGGHERPLIVHGHDAVEWCHEVDRHDGVSGRLRIVERKLQGPGASTKNGRFVATDDEAQIERPGRGEKVGRAVARRRNEKQDAAHGPPLGGPAAKYS